jgi:hypothetical protein
MCNLCAGVDAWDCLFVLEGEPVYSFHAELPSFGLSPCLFVPCWTDSGKVPETVQPFQVPYTRIFPSRYLTFKIRPKWGSDRSS